MGKGRKNIPEHLKVLKGTQRADRLNTNAPGPVNEKMQPPPWLPTDCHQRFFEFRDRISVLSMDSSSWADAAAILAMRVCEIEECTRIIEAEGRTYKSETTSSNPAIGTDGKPFFPIKIMVKGHPAVSQRNEAMRHFQSLLSEFGQTPASISKISVPGNDKKKEKDPWDKVVGNGR